MIALLLETELSEAGFAVSLFHDAGEALLHLEAHVGEIRGIVTDIQIGPGGTGWDIARRGRELSPELAVVYTTGGNAGDWPAYGVPKSILIEKPFAVAQVITAISTLLNAGGEHHG